MSSWYIPGGGYFSTTPPGDDRDLFVSVGECAQRMRTSRDAVKSLIERRVLRSRPDGFGGVEVVPAIVSGAVDVPLPVAPPPPPAAKGSPHQGTRASAPTAQPAARRTR